jgi:hypothetical protein
VFYGFVATLTAQTKLLERANAHFESFDYRNALDGYLRALKSGESPYYVTLKIADCYRLLDMPVQSEEWYRKVLTFPDVPPITFWYLAQALHRQGRMQEGAQMMGKYYQTTGFRFSSIALDYLTYVDCLKADSARYQIVSLPLNSSGDEFAPFVHGDDLYFSVNRSMHSIVSLKDNRNQQPFFDLFVMKLNGKDSSKMIPAPSAFNSEYNDGPVYITSEGDCALVTRNREQGRNDAAELDVIMLQLSSDQSLLSAEYLPFKVDGVSVVHACMTPDKLRLFFASNMPGGFGGLDLYVSEFKGGFFSTPVNLGKEINTPGNECFPFYSVDGILFFASDGLPGLGGYDLFYCRQVDNNFSLPFNLGFPLNSEGDDTGLVLTMDAKTGYFASNRYGGRGGDDIYRVDLLTPLTYTKVHVRVISAEEQPLEGVQITILNKRGMLHNRFETSVNGDFTCYLPSGDYQFAFRKRMFQNHERQVVATCLWGCEMEMQVVMNAK